MSYIKLDRKMLEWEWFADPSVAHLWIYILLKANHKMKEWHGIQLEEGTLVTSESRLTVDTGLSRQQIRTALKKLISTNEITKKSTREYTILKVNKWASYQFNNQDLTIESNVDATIEPTSPVTTPKEIKNTRSKEKKEIYKERKVLLGEYKNVSLTEEQLEKLKTEFPTDWQERIERVSNYCASTGKKYKDYLATIRNWARKEKPVETPKKYEDDLW